MSTQSNIHSNPFADIMRRFLITIGHVQLAADKFGDLSELPAGYEQAGLTVCEAAKSLNKLHDELDQWSVQHTPRGNPFGEAASLQAIREQQDRQLRLIGMLEVLEAACGNNQPVNYDAAIAAVSELAQSIHESLDADFLAERAQQIEAETRRVADNAQRHENVTRPPAAEATRDAGELKVEDCVGDLDGVIAVLRLVDAKLWELMSEEGMDALNAPYFAVESALREFDRVTSQLREYPKGFAVGAQS